MGRPGPPDDGLAGQGHAERLPVPVPERFLRRPPPDCARDHLAHDGGAREIAPQDRACGRPENAPHTEPSRVPGHDPPALPRQRPAVGGGGRCCAACALLLPLLRRGRKNQRGVCSSSPSPGGGGARRAEGEDLPPAIALTASSSVEPSSGKRARSFASLTRNGRSHW